MVAHPESHASQTIAVPASAYFKLHSRTAFRVATIITCIRNTRPVVVCAVKGGTQMTKAQWIKRLNKSRARYKVLIAEKKGIIAVLDKQIRQMEKDVKRFGKIVKRFPRG